MGTHFFVDPGFTATGLIVYGASTQIINDFGCSIFDDKVRKASNKKIGVTLTDLGRMQEIATFLNKYRKRFPWVKALHMEIPGGSQSSRAAKTLGLVAGMLTGWTKAIGLDVHFYTQGDVKLAVVGKEKGKQTSRRRSDLKPFVEAAVKERWKDLDWDTFPKYMNEHLYDAAGLIFAAETRGLI